MTATDFLASPTSIFDLGHKVTKNRTSSGKATGKKDDTGFRWREFVSEQPPLGNNERFPSFLTAGDDEVLLSSVAIEGGYRAKEIGMWVPARHQLVVETIRVELADTRYKTHATGLGYASGCRGPLCKRYHRELTYEHRELVAKRDQILRERRKADAGDLVKRRKPRINEPVYERMKVAAPAYAGVDALIVRFCLLQYGLLDLKNGRGLIQKWADIAQNPADIASFLVKTYGKDVFFA